MKAVPAPYPCLASQNQVTSVSGLEYLNGVPEWLSHKSNQNGASRGSGSQGDTYVGERAQRERLCRPAGVLEAKGVLREGGGRAVRESGAAA